jgi:hypothetical protein
MAAFGRQQLAGADEGGAGVAHAGQVDASRELRLGDVLDHEAAVREEPQALVVVEGGGVAAPAVVQLRPAVAAGREVGLG